MTIHSRDLLTPEMRSWNMSRIKGENTKPELLVRKTLHSMGFRFRLHVKDLPGKPDIVLPKYRTVIFVHGCFWHRHNKCKRCTTPTKNRDFWVEKFRKNVERDKQNIEALDQLGWKVLVAWECEIEADRTGLLSKRLLA